MAEKIDDLTLCESAFDLTAFLGVEQGQSNEKPLSI
jgi:hypothetical protein